jgi:hypothetical protein
MIYVPDFYARSEADALFEFVRSLPFVRPKNKRNHKSLLRRLSFPGYSPPLTGVHTASRYGAPELIDTAPQLYKDLSARLTAYAGKNINYMSTIGYLPDDHMNFHQHREDRAREDQTVYVLSLGAVHPVAIRSGQTVGKKFVPDGRQEIFYPAHGSLYVLPSDFNVSGSGNEHEHAVLEGDEYSHQELRVSINCKHIPAGLSPEEMKKACSRAAGIPACRIMSKSPSGDRKANVTSTAGTR